MSTNFISYMNSAAEQYGIKLSNMQLAQFDKYFQMLIEWNEKINLTAITDPQEVAVKHMIDSLSAWRADIFKPGAFVIDVGTGAGFPGIPLKIFQPDIKLTLLDSLNKRIKFLQEVSEALGFDDVTCIHARAEEAAMNTDFRERYDVAVSRAVARLQVLSEYCLPFVKQGGCFVALKGMKYAEEAADSVKALKILGGDKPDIAEVKLPGLEDKRAVLYIRKIKATPKKYPRKAGTPDKSPL